MPAGLDTIMSNYELLKKAWEAKKLEEVEKLLLTLKIEFAVTQPANERVRFLKLIFSKVFFLESFCCKKSPNQEFGLMRFSV